MNDNTNNPLNTNEEQTPVTPSVTPEVGGTNPAVGTTEPAPVNPLVNPEEPTPEVQSAPALPAEESTPTVNSASQEPQAPVTPTATEVAAPETVSNEATVQEPTPVNNLNFMPKEEPTPVENPEPSVAPTPSVAEQPVSEQPVNPTPVAEPTPVATPEVNQNSTPVENVNNDQTIGKVKKEKKSIVPVVLIFVAIIGACIALPYIYELVSPYFDKKTPTPVPSEPTNPTEPETPVEPEEPIASSELIDITPTSSLTYDKLTFNNFNLTTENDLNYISFVVTNNGEEAYSLKEDLYLELYNSENTYLGRTKVNITNAILAGGNLTLKSEITSDVKSNAMKVSVVSKTETDYPSVTLGEGNTLTCRKGMSVITYTFEDNKLSVFNDVYNYSVAKTEEDIYASNSLIYRNKLNSYINYGAITSFVENETETDKTFTASLTLKLSDSFTAEQVSTLKSMNENYYDKDTTPEKIKFIQEAKAFTCE